MAFDLDKLERQAVELDAELAAKRFSVPKIPAVGSTAEVIGDPGRWRIKPGADNG
jgi:hypothetical protein